MSAAGQPIVSIVLPVHNGARFLRESIDSCLAQTFRNLELIVVDDASTDATAEITANYARRDPRVIAIRNERNLRLPGSLNAGFARARGQYLTWTSDDNRYRPAALAVFTEMLDARPDVDVVYSDYSVIDEAGAVVAFRRVSPIDRIARANCVGASFLYRRAVHDALNGYDASQALVEDYDFWLRAAGRFRFEPVAVDLYEYRLHSHSLSAEHDAAIVNAHRRLLRGAVPHMAWLGRGGQARACVQLARTSLARGDTRAALEDLWLGCRLAPEAVAADCAGRVYRGLFRRQSAA